MNLLLISREKRGEYTKEISNENSQFSTLSLKANTPGKNKNSNESLLLVKIFDNLLSKLLKEYIIKKEKINSLDGDYFLFVIDYDSYHLKKLSYYIETYHPLGKYVDLDVYKAEKAITRSDLSLSNRKCFICSEDAHVCTRNQTHDIHDLLFTIKDSLRTYLLKSLKLSVNDAIVTELKLFPKFGLVSKINSGCHTDMDYATFIISKCAIMPFIEDYLITGSQNIIAKDLQKIGLEADQAMFESTNNINTYKGLIFLLGIFLPSLVDTILSNETKVYLINNIKSISKDIIGDYYLYVKDKKTLSNSDKIYLLHGIKGVREEALNGLPSLFSDNSKSSIDSLIYFMSVLEDTTIIHKSDLKTFRKVKKEMKSIIDNGGYFNNEQFVNSLSETYIKNSISPGGSADMLVLSEIYKEYNFLLK